MWRCSKCNEEQPETFELCWNCRTVREGLERHQAAESVMPRNAEALPSTEADSTSLREGVPPTPREQRYVPIAIERRCVKCNSAEMIWKADVYANGAPPESVCVAVHERPDAFFMKRTHYGWLKACICGECGFTEFYVDNPGELLESFRNSERT